MASQNTKAPISAADAQVDDSSNSQIETSGEASSSSSSSPTPTPTTTTTRICTNCSKQEADPEHKPLKACARCQSAYYCNKDCQKGDFKRHKKICAHAAQKYAMTADIKMEVPRAAPKEAHRGGLQKWQFDT